MPRALHRAAVRLLLLLLAGAGALVVAEVVVRRTDALGISYYRDVNRYFNEAIALVKDGLTEDGRLFQNKPDTALSFVRFDWRTDAWGFRASAAGAPFAAERAPGASAPLRLLFLGDSVTLAWGVNDEDSWIRRLERDARAPDGRALECLNAGHLSYDTVQEADYLAAHAAALAPDAVVLTYVTNDLDSTWEQYKGLLVPGEGVRVPRVTLGQKLQGWLVTRFRGVYGVYHCWRELARQHGPPPASIEGEPAFVQGWPRSRAALERMRGACAARGVPLVVLDHTTPRVPALAAWCAERGVACHPFRFTDEEEARDIHNSKADAHANALGQELLEKKALAALRAEGLLAR